MSADIEVVLDLREYGPRVDGVHAFVDLWERMEPALVGRDLRREPLLRLQAGRDGSLGLQVVRIATPGPVGPDTTFRVVSVRERPTLRDRCRICGGYAPFVCGDCTGGGGPDRLCDDHAMALPGSLRTVCKDHHPRCADQRCRAPATFRCAGPACENVRPWCDRHRRGHPSDPDTVYCLGCHDIVFPVCEDGGCSAVGTVACEHVGRKGKACGRRSCARHAHRWQVYGPEKPGLALCGAHRSGLVSLAADDTLFLIVAASARRTPPMWPPSLPGFGFTLRKVGHPQLAVDYPGMLGRLRRVQGQVTAAGVKIKNGGAHLERWEKDAAGKAAGKVKGEKIAVRLRELVRRRDPNGGAEIADGLVVVEFTEARPERGGQPARPARLWVDVHPDLRGRFVGKQYTNLRAYSAELGVDVMLEGSGKRLQQSGPDPGGRRAQGGNGDRGRRRR